MSIITDTWRQLVRRRLWPVAVLLIAAAAAVPVLLAKEPESVPAPAPAAPQGAVAEASETLVTLADADGATEARRRVLGKPKDPFAPAPAPKAKAAKQDEPAAGDTEGGDTSSGGGSQPSSGGADPSGGAPPAGEEPKPKKKAPPANSITIRFSDGGGQSVKGVLRKGEALPSPEEPVIVYVGPEQGGKVAVFMIDSSVVPQGDGECDPDPENCEMVRLRVGETEFFDVTDAEGNVTAQWQIDLIEIHAKKAGAKSAKKARAARAAARELLHGRVSRDAVAGL
jgi:hypothetical protein